MELHGTEAYGFLYQLYSLFFRFGSDFVAACCVALSAGPSVCIDQNNRSPDLFHVMRLLLFSFPCRRTGTPLMVLPFFLLKMNSFEIVISLLDFCHVCFLGSFIVRAFAFFILTLHAKHICIEH